MAKFYFWFFFCASRLFFYFESFFCVEKVENGGGKSQQKTFPTIKGNDSHGVTFILRRDIKTNNFFIQKKNSPLIFIFWVCLQLFLCICWSMMPLIFIEIQEKLIKIRKWHNKHNTEKKLLEKKEDYYE